MQHIWFASQSELVAQVCKTFDMYGVTKGHSRQTRKEEEYHFACHNNVKYSKITLYVFSLCKVIQNSASYHSKSEIHG